MWLVYDLEATGLDTKTDRVTEYGIALYDPYLKSILRLESQLVYTPGMMITDENVRLTGISEEMLKKRSCSHEVFVDRLRAALMIPEVTHVVAHYGRGYDIPLSQAECDRAGKTLPEHKLIDTWEDVVWRTSRKSLIDLATDHGFLNPFPHRALPDVLTLCKLVSLYDYKEIERRASIPSVQLIAQVKYEDKDKAKAAGFRWKPENKTWWKSVKECDLEAEAASYSFPTQRLMA